MSTCRGRVPRSAPPQLADAPSARAADADLFVYGTLLLPAVIEALIGRVPPRLPAVLPGYRRYRLTGRAYPAIVAEPAARVDGLVYRGLAPRERMILDAFEGDAYERRRVRARTRRGELLAADAYVLARGHERLLQRAPAWSLEEFAAGSGAAYVRRCAALRAGWPATGR
jgi:gamma-glutamylcyclotransferase (GGCT)/AIG2-like uncharacterized protein YtfP